MYYVNGVLGTNKKELSMWLSTGYEHMGVFTKDCPETKCKVDDRIDLAESTSLVDMKIESYTKDYVNYNSRQLLENSFSGGEYEDHI
jgi:hypothetical protein|tara:strand:+ start:210 stop:470 length:261 start_codon:yes stop_codon:yes gene_type:complete